MTTKNRARNGFTLIELLVVIGIVAVVAAILFPVFATVRERGRRTACQSNLKQIALATQQYVQDNEGLYPGVHNWALAANSYAKNAQIFRCPDAPPDEPNDASLVDFSCISAPCQVNAPYDVSQPVNYLYDLPRLVTFSALPTPNSRGNHESAIATPSTTWLNMELVALGDGDQWYWGRSVTTSCGSEFDGNTLHSGAGNYSYIDGHVKWLTPEEAGETECANGPLPTPFKS